MNKRRMANRHESMGGDNKEGMTGGGGVGSTGKGEHDYGKGHEMGNSSGSFMHREVMGPGPLEGAGEVVAGGPGVAANRKVAHDPQASALGSQEVYKTASTSKTPKGMKVYDEGE